MKRIGRWAKLIFIVALSARAETVRVTEDFSKDPGWDGRNNVRTERGPEKRQEFGYSTTGFAGSDSGEIGGWVCRSIQPAWYALAIAPRTLRDRLSASGRFAVTHSEGGSSLLFGWFHHTSRGWRTPNALVFRLDGESGHFRVFFEYGTRNRLTGGGQTFEGAYQTNPKSLIPADGKPHTWRVDYDPKGAEEPGEIRFVLDGVEYRAELAQGHKADGAEFDRFGILNVQIHGDGMEAYFDDLTVGGEAYDFATDPRWEGAANRARFHDAAIRPQHDFKYRTSHYAGRQPGEIGGYLWRIESVEPGQAGYYGAPIGRLTLNDELFASGTLSFRSAGVDSGLLMGWFNSLTAIGAPPSNFLGALIEGPSRVGHYFRAVYGSSDDQRGIQEEGPLLRPDGSRHAWTLHYDPDANDGTGEIIVTLDDETVKFGLTPAARKGNATFDRFGIVSWHRGGHFVEMYFDDLTYTKEAAPK